MVSAVSLKDRFEQAQAGDFVVCELNRSYNLIRIHENKGNRLILEEITLPSKLPKEGKADWEQWLSSGAEGHTSWTVIEVDLENSQILECFSFFRNAWLILSEEDSFLIKLLHLDLSPIPTSKRRKIGPPPRGDLDTRKLWTPPLVFDGKPVSNPKFDAYEILWPKDGTPLANKKLEFYFDQAHPEFPFPYWGRVMNAAEAAYKFRVVDSGKHLASPTKEMPRRSISFTKPPIFKEEGLIITLSVPLYYKGIELFALDATLLEPSPIRLPFKREYENEILTCKVEKSELNKLLVSGKEYRFYISCKEPHEISVEAKKTMIFLTNLPR